MARTVLVSKAFPCSHGPDRCVSGNPIWYVQQWESHLSIELIRNSGVEPFANGTGCCAPDVTQHIMLSNTSSFPTAQVKTMAGLPTEGLFHVPTKIIDPSIAWEFAQFDPAGPFKEPTTAGTQHRFEKGECITDTWYRCDQ